MKIRHCLFAVVLLFAFTGGAVLAAPSAAADAPRKLRVGIYDSRAISIAYASSKYNPVAEKMKELKAAEAAHDTTRVAELKAWGESLQQKLHWQGFGRYPVDDLLACIQPELPRIAREADVDVIAATVEFAAPGVEVVDITNRLVEPYHPPERAKKWIADLKHVPRVPFETLDKMKADE